MDAVDGVLQGLPTRDRSQAQKQADLSAYGVRASSRDRALWAFKSVDDSSVVHALLHSVSDSYRQMTPETKQQAAQRIVDAGWATDLRGLAGRLQVNVVCFLTCASASKEPLRLASTRGPLKPDWPFVMLLSDGNGLQWLSVGNDNGRFTWPFAAGRAYFDASSPGPCATYAEGAFVVYQRRIWRITKVLRNNKYLLESQGDSSEQATVLGTSLQSSVEPPAVSDEALLNRREETQRRLTGLIKDYEEVRYEIDNLGQYVEALVAGV